MRGLTYGPPNLNWLVTADLHLTDRPRDAYRFGLFKWLAEQQKEYAIGATFILGDLTDRKDNHSAALVNKIVDELLQLKPPIYILQGNHDAFDRNSPFFKFLNCVEGIEFITEPRLIPELELAMIPHYPDQASFDEACSIIPPKWAVFLHACLNGAVTESGTRLTGLSPRKIENLEPRLWLCGDIHRPQILDCGAGYVGAPYQIKFTDPAIGSRVLLINDPPGQWPNYGNLHYDCLRRWVLHINDPAEIERHTRIDKGDQVKIKFHLTAERLVDWPQLRAQTLAACAARGLEVFGVQAETPQSPSYRGHQVKKTTPQDIFTEFCQHEKVAKNLYETGLELLK